MSSAYNLQPLIIYENILSFINNDFKKENGHFIDVELTVNGTDPIKLIRHACQNVSYLNQKELFSRDISCAFELRGHRLFSLCTSLLKKSN